MKNKKLNVTLIYKNDLCVHWAVNCWQKDAHTCNLDNCSNPVDFTGEDGIRVQHLHFHPHGDVIPLGTKGSL